MKRLLATAVLFAFAGVASSTDVAARIEVGKGVVWQVGVGGWPSYLPPMPPIKPLSPRSYITIGGVTATAKPPLGWPADQYTAWEILTNVGDDNFRFFLSDDDAAFNWSGKALYFYKEYDSTGRWWLAGYDESRPIVENSLTSTPEAYETKIHAFADTPEKKNRKLNVEDVYKIIGEPDDIYGKKDEPGNYWDEIWCGDDWHVVIQFNPKRKVEHVKWVDGAYTGVH